MGTPLEKSLLSQQRDAWILHLAARLPEGMKDSTAGAFVKMYRKELSSKFGEELFDYLVGDKTADEVGENIVLRAGSLREMAKKDLGRRPSGVRRLRRPRR